MKNIPPIIIDIPGENGAKSFSFKYEYSDSSKHPVRVQIPNVDSILKSIGVFNGDSLMFNGKDNHFVPDSLASMFKMFDDSLMIFDKGEFKKEMKQLQKEMEKMKEEMKKLRIEIHQDTLKKEKTDSEVEI